MAITRRRARTRASTAWVIAAAGAALLAACAAPAANSGSADPATTPDPTPSMTATPPPTATPAATSQPTASPTASAAWTIGPNGECDAAQLEYALESRPMDSGMSQFYWNLQMTNTSDTACTLEGYPQVQLVSSGTGERIGAVSGRDAPQTEGVVDMPPGASAYSLLHLRQAGAYGCALAPVAEVAVTPPYGNVSRNVITPNEIDGCDDSTTELVSAGPLTAAPAPG